METKVLAKYYFKYLPLVIIIFSLISTFLSIFCIDFDKFPETNLFQSILFVIDFVAVLFFILLNTKSLEKSIKNIIISLIIYFYLFINIIVLFNYYFIESNLAVILYSLINIFYIIPIAPFLFIGIKFNIPIPEIVSIFIMLFFIILTNNIVFTFIFKYIKYKNDNKYITLTLYYLQSNIVSIILLGLLYLGKIG